MTDRRAMAEMLSEIAEAILIASRRPGLRATRLEVSLPVELQLRPGGELAAELPRFLRRTDFDAPPSRLTVVWEEAS
ncbi:MAG: hypothetical protein AB7O44_29415 [Hyphomicrobiaceae bacterium]